MSTIAYYSLQLNAPKRLETMRRHAAAIGWRAIRHYGLHNYESAFCALSQGFNNKAPVWYAHTGPQFRDEKPGHEIVNLRHTGWYGDSTVQSDLHIGIVGRLSHGRFIAGYLVQDTNERVYFPRVFDDENEAACMSDEHARIAAENADEYNEAFHEAYGLRDLIDAKRRDVFDYFPSRDNPRIRADMREIIADIRQFESELSSLCASHNISF